MEDVEAVERAVLGGVLLKPHLYGEAIEMGLTWRHFYREPHRLLWRAFAACWEAHRSIDLTLLEEFVSDREWEDVGGYAYVAGFPASCPSTVEWPAYVERVLAFFGRRHLVQWMRQAVQADEAGAPLEQLVSLVRRGLDEVSLSRLAAVFDRGDHAEIGTHLAGRLGEAVWDRGELRRWTPGGWVKVPLDGLRNMASEYAGTSKMVGRDKDGAPKFAPVKLSQRDVEGLAQRACELVARPGWFDSRPPGVALEGSFVRVLDGDLVVEELRQDHRVLAEHVLPWPYRPDADCPRWLQFLTEIWPEELVPDQAERIRLLGEWVGACLFGLSTRYGRALVLWGTGANGKSTLLDAISTLVPSTTSIPFQRIGEPNGYWLAALRGSQLNLVEELPAEALKNTAEVKAVIDGSSVSAREVRGKVFTFHPSAGHIVAANTLPSVSDSSHGFWRRFYLLDFPRTFAPEDQDPELGRALAEELPGIATWAMAHVRVLMRRGRFIAPRGQAEALDAWRTSSTPALAWADQALVKSTDGEWQKSRELYGQFKAWAKEGGYRPVAERKWAEQLKGAGWPHGRTRYGSVWYVQLKPDENQGGGWGDAA